VCRAGTPNWGMGRAGNSPVYSEQFRSACGTRRPRYGKLSERWTDSGRRRFNMSGRDFMTLLGGSKPHVGTKNLLLYYIASISSVFAVIASCGLSPAKAHDWYPHECCHGGDCAPVDNVTRIVMAASGQTGLILSSKLGTALLPPDFPVRESKDHRMHVCMRPSLYGGMGITCVFMPPSMY
jgi:hypothetical protein